jgi:hypothetical protein
VLAASIFNSGRDADEVQSNIDSFQADIPEQLWTDLRAEGLID